MWTTDKDGILLALLASEIQARTGKSPSEHYRSLVERHGEPAYARIDAAATREEKAKLAALSPDDVTAESLAGEPITAKLTEAPGNGAAIGGLKVVTESAWFAARPQRHRGRLQDLRRVLPRARPPGPGAGRGQGGRRRPPSAAERSAPPDAGPRGGKGSLLHALDSAEVPLSTVEQHCCAFPQHCPQTTAEHPRSTAEHHC